MVASLPRVAIGATPILKRKILGGQKIVGPKSPFCLAWYHVGGVVFKKKAAVLSVYLNIYWRLQNKPQPLFIWYICIYPYQILKEDTRSVFQVFEGIVLYPNLGRDFEDFQRRNVSGFLLNQLVSWNVARRWVVKSYYIFSVRFSSPLPTHLNRNNVLLKPYYGNTVDKLSHRIFFYLYTYSFALRFLCKLYSYCDWCDSTV